MHSFQGGYSSRVGGNKGNKYFIQQYCKQDLENLAREGTNPNHSAVLLFK